MKAVLNETSPLWRGFFIPCFKNSKKGNQQILNAMKDIDDLNNPFTDHRGKYITILEEYKQEKQRT